MENKLALVTGGTGFIGSHLVDLLLSKGYQVRCITRKTSSLKWLEGKNLEIFDCGLTDVEKLMKAIDGVDYIFHVAGVVKSKKPEGYFKGNVDATKTLLEAASGFTSKLKNIMVVSSLTAVGPSKDGNPVDETTPCNPITTYGRSKLAQEKICYTFMNRLPITICRVPAVYGERDTETFVFFKTMNNRLMTLIGFDKKLVSLIHVWDLVNGFMIAAESEKSSGQTYFISSEEFYTWSEIGKVTEKALRKKTLKVRVPHTVVYSLASIAQLLSYFSTQPATLNLEKAKDIVQSNWICSPQKAVKELGYSQRISISDGVERTVNWYKQMRWMK
jgi:nucleoside-diphosphate-sugar epimerase